MPPTPRPNRLAARFLLAALFILPCISAAPAAPAPTPTPTPAASPRPIPFPSFSSPGAQRFLRRLRLLLAPGPLSQAHAALETPDGRDRSHRSPHAGKLTRPCTDCHTTKGFDLAASKFDHNHMTSFPLAGLHATRNCALCHPDLTFQPKGGAACAACHSDVEAFYAGTAFPALTPTRADPMHGTVHCQDCHSIADAKGEDEPVRRRCVACHTPRITTVLDTSLEMLVARLKALSPTVANDPRYKPAVEAIWKHAPHNPIYAGKLLRALEAKPVEK